MLRGKAGIVTGAGRGIGREIALALSAEGASVVVNDAGVVRDAIFHKMSEADWDDVIAVHLKGTSDVFPYPPLL